MNNKNMLPFENMNKGRCRETTSIHYDNNTNKGNHKSDTNPLIVSASCIAFGLIAAPYVSPIYSLSFVLAGGALFLLDII